MAVESAAAPAIAQQAIAANQRQRWWVMMTLVVVMVFVLGGTAITLPIFFTPLVQKYGWSHTRTSLLPSIFLLTAGAAAPLTGWLLDRFEAKLVMVIGAALAAGGLLWASQSGSFAPIACAWVVIGIGSTGATVVPCSLVAANWFADNRGLAIGATMSGSGAGGILLPPLTDYLIRTRGISAAFAALAMPMIVIVIPLILAFIRTRPARAVKSSVAQDVANIPGLELGPAMRTPTFWLLGVAQIGASVGLAACFYHMVPFLIHSGYAPQHAALVQSAVTAVGVPGNLLIGAIVDRISGRRVLPFTLLTMAAALILLLGTAHGQGWLWYVAGFVLMFGMTAGQTASVAPVAMVETLGLRRFGSISGLLGFAGTIGLAAGAMLSGWIFDATASYSAAFELGAAFIVVGMLAAFGLKPAEDVGATPAAAIAHGH